ncbi:hypothetical protein [Methylobacterium oryzae]|uniref:ATP-binding protein n=1 Tax=Methylobacterium oryzae TaxID=334852 RepID=A0ABU7TR14_9HYPH
MGLNVADYHADRAALDAFARASCANRAFFLDGSPGMGKSYILEWLCGVLPAAHRVALVELDRPQGGQSPQLILCEITDQVGRDRFPRFLQVEHREAEGRRSRNAVAIVRDVHIEGDGNFVTASTAETPRDKELVTRDLTNALLDDLRQMSVPAGHTVVVALDGYHDLDEAIHRWLVAVLVPGLARVDHVRVIVSGRTALQPNAKRRIGTTHTSTLGGVTEVEEWERVLDAEGRFAPAEHTGSYLKAMIDYFEGAPNDIMRWMMSLPRKEG